MRATMSCVADEQEAIRRYVEHENVIGKVVGNAGMQKSPTWICGTGT